MNVFVEGSLSEVLRFFPQLLRLFTQVGDAFAHPAVKPSPGLPAFASPRRPCPFADLPNFCGVVAL